MEEDIHLQDEDLSNFQVSGPLQGASTSQSVFDINDPKVLAISFHLYSIYRGQSNS